MFILDHSQEVWWQEYQVPSHSTSSATTQKGINACRLTPFSILIQSWTPAHWIVTPKLGSFLLHSTSLEILPERDRRNVPRWFWMQSSGWWRLARAGSMPQSKGHLCPGVISWSVGWWLSSHKTLNVGETGSSFLNFNVFKSNMMTRKNWLRFGNKI